jgi:hypothetical protein
MSRHWLLAILIVMLANFVNGQSVTATASFQDKKFKPEALQEDFRLLRKALEEAHPGLCTYTSPDKTKTRFDSIYASLQTEQTELQFYSVVTSLVAGIGCGHTPCFLPHDFMNEFEDKKCPLFPFRIKILNRHIFILSNFSTDSSIVIGSELMSLNNQNVSTIIDEIIPHISSDGYNLSLKYHLLEDDFMHYYAELVGQPVWFHLLLKKPGDELQVDHTVPALYLPQIHRIEAKRYGTESTLPAKLKPLDFQLTEDKIGLLRISSFDSRDISTAKQHFHSFIKNVFDTLKNKGINDLVIDLRNNVGGNDDYGWYLYSFLTDSAFQYYHRVELVSNKRFSFLRHTRHPFCINFTHLFVKRDKIGRYIWTHGPDTRTHKPNRTNYWGKTYVLINGESFSTTAEFASMVRTHHKAEFVGEESGGALEGNNSGVEMLLTLPNTHLRVKIPIMKYVCAVPDSNLIGRGIMPDYPVQPGIEDILTKNDKEQEFILELIRKKNCKGCGR